MFQLLSTDASKNEAGEFCKFFLLYDLFVDWKEKEFR